MKKKRKARGAFLSHKERIESLKEKCKLSEKKAQEYRAKLYDILNENFADVLEQCKRLSPEYKKILIRELKK